MIGDAGGIVGWTSNGSTAQLGYFGYGKVLSGADIASNTVTFATTSEQTVIYVFRNALASAVSAKGNNSVASAANPQIFSGFALGGGAKEVLFIGLGAHPATLTTPVLPPGNTSAPSSTWDFSARWGAASLYVSSANLSYTPSTPATILEVFKWELD